VDGRKVGTDINLYKLFFEQCHNLLRPGGCCGIVIPSGIYTDLGAKQLREILFSSSKFDALLGLSNERFIFEGVHHDFKFCILTLRKSGLTESFRAAFRINARVAIAPNATGKFSPFPGRTHSHSCRSCSATRSGLAFNNGAYVTGRCGRKWRKPASSPFWVTSCRRPGAFAFKANST